MFERFTDRARRVVVLATSQARELGHSYIGTEHILLGLIEEGEGVAAKVLTSVGVGALAETRERVAALLGQGAAPTAGHIPFTRAGKKVLELSLREALQLGHNYIGTEHILLGLLRIGDLEDPATQVLVTYHPDAWRGLGHAHFQSWHHDIRKAVIEFIVASFPPRSRPAGTHPPTTVADALNNAIASVYANTGPSPVLVNIRSAMRLLGVVEQGQADG